VIGYGAALRSLLVPDRDGRLDDVVLGHDDLAGYVSGRHYFGASVGRYANRIAGASFELDGRRYELVANDGPNALHGGPAGFDRRVWTTLALGDDPHPFVTFGLSSPDGEEGYPGALEVEATYALTGPTELTVHLTARTSRPTVVNLTNHAYFNLGGVGGGDVLDHKLTIAAAQYLPTDASAIPLDSPEPVAGTPFDFRTPQPIGARIREADEQLRRGRGYDHNWCLAPARLDEPRLAARLEEPRSGRVMELLTDQPGLQFYSGNFLDGSIPGKGGRLYRQSDALSVEPQIWPDAPNRPDFPSARLDPAQKYLHTSIYRFSAA